MVLLKLKLRANDFQAKSERSQILTIHSIGYHILLVLRNALMNLEPCSVRISQKDGEAILEEGYPHENVTALLEELSKM